MQDREHELWECPPLRAWLSRKQCAANRRSVAGEHSARSPTTFGERKQVSFQLRECKSCRGVAWWAKRTGSPARSLASSQLIANHVRDDARRRQLGAEDLAQSDRG